LCVLTDGDATLLGQAFQGLISAADHLRLDIFELANTRPWSK